MVIDNKKIEHNIKTYNLDANLYHFYSIEYMDKTNHNGNEVVVFRNYFNKLKSYIGNDRCIYFWSRVNSDKKEKNNKKAKYINIIQFIKTCIKEFNIYKGDNIHKIYFEKVVMLEKQCGSIYMFDVYLSQFIAAMSNEVSMFEIELFNENISEKIRYGFKCIEVWEKMQKYNNVIDKEKLFKNIKRYLEHNTEEKTDLNQIAEKYHVSRSYISKLFRAYSAKSFKSYVINLKIEKSKELLKKGICINEVANILGYSSSQYYIRQFKLNNGVTPKKYQVYSNINQNI